MKAKADYKQTTDYKQTAVGMITGDWDVVSVEQVAAGERNAIVGGPFGSDLVSNDYVSSGVPVIRGQNMRQKWVSGDFACVSDAKADSLSANLARPRDIIFTQRGTLGQVSLVPAQPYDRYVVSQSQMKVTVDESVIDPLFCYYVFTSSRHQEYIHTNVVQTGIPHINLGILRRIPVQLPPLHEQRAIAEALSDVDALIERIDALIDKKRAIKQATMQRLLTGRQRLPGFSNSWTTKRLGELASIQRGASPRPISDPKWYDQDSGVGWVRISDLTASNGIRLSETGDYLSKKGIAASRFLPTGSLIMSICATIGLPVITDIDACIHDGFVGFTDLDGVEQRFLYYKLKELESEFQSAGQTGSQSNLNSDIVRNQEVSLPPLDEQNAIADIFSDMDHEIEALHARRDKTKDIKQGMMQELLTGRTRLV